LLEKHGKEELKISSNRRNWERPLFSRRLIRTAADDDDEDRYTKAS